MSPAPPTLPSAPSRRTAAPSATSATSTSRPRPTRPPACAAPAPTCCLPRVGRAAFPPTSSARRSPTPPRSSLPAVKAASPPAIRRTCCAPTRRARSGCRCNYDRAMPRATRPAATGAAATALLLHGDERFLIDEKARATVAGWTAELVSDFGLETLDGIGLNAARLRDAVLQAPFLDPYRVVYVRAVAPGRSEALAPALGHVPPTTRVLMTVSGRLGSTNKLAKAMTAAGGRVEEMPRLVRRALSDWVSKRAVEKHGLTPNIAAQVVRLTPPDLGIIDSELTKLAAYKASGAKLTTEVAIELLAGGREDEFFRLADNLLPHPTPQAIDVARNLTRSGMGATLVAYRMARHIALVLEVKARQ